jgi:hypothetical protein
MTMSFGPCRLNAGLSRSIPIPPGRPRPAVHEHVQVGVDVVLQKLGLLGTSPALQVSAIAFCGGGQGAFVVRAAGAPLNCEQASLSPLELFDRPRSRRARRLPERRSPSSRSAMRQP